MLNDDKLIQANKTDTKTHLIEELEESQMQSFASIKAFLQPTFSASLREIGG